MYLKIILESSKGMKSIPKAPKGKLGQMIGYRQDPNSNTKGPYLCKQEFVDGCHKSSQVGRKSTH